MANADIARELGIGVGTVERHVHDILERWQLSSRVGIAGVVGAHGVERSVHVAE